MTWLTRLALFSLLIFSQPAYAQTYEQLIAHMENKCRLQQWLLSSIHEVRIQGVSSLEEFEAMLTSSQMHVDPSMDAAIKRKALETAKIYYTSTHDSFAELQGSTMAICLMDMEQKLLEMQ